MSKIIQLQSVIDNEISIDEAKKMVIIHKGESYTFFDEGTTRHVFVNESDTKVIKILKRSLGKDYNSEELDIYNDASPEDKEQMTPTTLFNGVIEQDYCTPIKFGGIKLTPEQRDFASSCRGEVGWTSENKLVCFDLDEYKKY